MNTSSIATPGERDALAIIRLAETRRANRLREHALRIIRRVIYTIEYPRYSDIDPITLSLTDKREAEGAGMLALAEIGFFGPGKHVVKKADFRAVRNAINGRDCLRLRCKREVMETETQSLLSCAERVSLSAYTSARANPSRNNAKNARAVMRILRAAHGADESRKRDASFRSQREFFLSLVKHAAGKGERSLAPEAFRKRQERFLDYLRAGAQALMARPLAPSDADSITRALASRAFA